LYELIKSGNLVAYPDNEIRLAVQRAVALETSRGWKITKEKQSHRIDVVVALAMAALAAVQEGNRPAAYVTAHSFFAAPGETYEMLHERWLDQLEPEARATRIRVEEISEAAAEKLGIKTAAKPFCGVPYRRGLPVR
jgi:hypothetical protein